MILYQFLGYGQIAGAPSASSSGSSNVGLFTITVEVIQNMSWCSPHYFNYYKYFYIYIYIYIYRRFRGSEYALVAAPQTGKSISLSFRVRVVRASERARRSCVGAWGVCLLTAGLQGCKFSGGSCALFEYNLLLYVWVLSLFAQTVSLFAQILCTGMWVLRVLIAELLLYVWVLRGRC